MEVRSTSPSEPLICTHGYGVHQECWPLITIISHCFKNRAAHLESRKLNSREYTSAPSTVALVSLREKLIAPSPRRTSLTSKDFLVVDTPNAS